MKYKLFFRIAAVFILLAVAVSAAPAAKVTIGDVDIDSSGEQASATLYLDEAPDGLAGYILNLTVDQDIAKIVKVDYPGWASMKDTKGLESGTDVQLSVVDLGKNIQTGAKNIELATVTFQGTSAGSTIIHISHDTFDDDLGDIMGRTLYDGALVVGDAEPPVMPTVSATTTSNKAVTEQTPDSTTRAAPLATCASLLAVVAGILLFAVRPFKRDNAEK